MSVAGVLVSLTVTIAAMTGPFLVAFSLCSLVLADAIFFTADSLDRMIIVMYGQKTLACRARTLARGQCVVRGAGLGELSDVAPASRRTAPASGPAYGPWLLIRTARTCERPRVSPSPALGGNSSVFANGHLSGIDPR